MNPAMRICVSPSRLRRMCQTPLLGDVVMGRKNHYGSKSERGTQVAALFYSLIETAKLRGVDPAAYLLTAARTAIASPGTPLLPPRAG